jgi:tRNA dimethylallyltransferase
MGPTASGKTTLSLEIAERFNGEIVSCDSVAVYRGMEIGTAKPSPAERARVPHHLIDIANPDQPCTAGDYSRLARTAITGITGRGHLPIVTGGTGLYLRALLDGLFAGPQRSDLLRERLRRSEARHGAGWLHRSLTRLDPESAALIHPNDRPKLIRAIEVTIEGRQAMSKALREGRDPLTGYRILRIGLDPERNALYGRINTRAAAMFEEGLIEETQHLLDLYTNRNLDRFAGPGAPCLASETWVDGTPTVPPARAPIPPALNSLGYRQAAAFLNGTLTREHAIKAAQQGHRNYAKRQMTWFRREPEVIWLRGFGDDPEIRKEALRLIEGNL